MRDPRTPKDVAPRAEGGAGLLAVVGLVLGGTIWTVDAFLDSGRVVQAATPSPAAVEPAAALISVPDCDPCTLQPMPAWHVEPLPPTPVACPDGLSDCTTADTTRRRSARRQGGSSAYWSRVGAPVSERASG
ncbi:MAG: hypothetical protein AAGB93_09275 [Planctomycetota bacterium]